MHLPAKLAEIFYEREFGAVMPEGANSFGFRGYLIKPEYPWPR